jgi:hypothetical protein
MRRSWLFAAAAGFGLLAAVFAWHASSTGAQDAGGDGAKKAAEGPLPIRQVILFNSGVGYFQREGEVDGNARIEVSFPVSEINDLLKSLILQDLGGGKISSVNYDSHDPIEKILRSFALDLNGNPTFGQLLNQVRGERVELLVKSDKKDGPAAKITGAIVGMEMKRRPVGKDAAQVVDLDTLNIAAAGGLQAVNLEDVLGVRFLNPTLESEFQRALRVLASSHDTQKKTVQLGFTGAGKRAVRVGYVVDRPIWKTSYRMRLEPNGKVFLQGWAMVENTSDDDWTDVRMALVTGRPISFEMNLYEPIYMPRPFVEPELFASLRPPVYGGAIAAEDGQPRAGRQPFNVGGSVAFGNPFGAPPPTPVSQGGPADIRSGMPSGFGGGGFAGGFAGGLGFSGGQISGSFNGGGFQGFGGAQGGVPNPYQINSRLGASMFQNRLTYDELQRRRQHELEAQKEAKGKGPALAGLNFKEGIDSVAAAAEIGDYYQYILDQRVTLSRQKSAMLPILDQTIEGAKVSIFNEDTHAKHPLLGLRLKNTSGQPLTQGPITVYDNNSYAGDTRILDLQPNEERLLSYALDVGVEIKSETKALPASELHFRLGEPNMTARYKLRQTKTYTIKNRSTHDRTVILEHAIQKDWKLVEPKAAEQTRSHYRFTAKVASGKTVAVEVAEEQPRVDQIALLGSVPYYTINEGLYVRPAVQVQEEKLVGLAIRKGFLAPTLKVRESRTYHVQNLSDVDRSFIIDHVIRKDWTRIDPKGEPQAGPGVVRLKLEVAKGKTGSQEIIEERVTTDRLKGFVELTQAKLREYLDHPVPSADVKAGLTKAAALHAKMMEAQARLAEFEQALRATNDDQARLRDNLKIIPQTAEPYKRFLDKFVAQETEIESLQKSIRQAQMSVTAARREFDLFIGNLSVD